MIESVNEKIILKYNKNEYQFSGENYEQLILLLTDPNVKLPPVFKISDKIVDDSEKYKAEIYKQFLEKVVAKRNETDEKLIEAEEKNNDSIK